MLNDQSYIKRFDSDNALGVAAKQFDQLRHTFEPEIDFEGEIKKIVVAGMGGSALAADFVNVWPTLEIPFAVVRDYHLPNWVDENTLVIASSYSGNTEETLSSLAEAEAKSAQIAVICAGGRLKDIAEENNYPLCQLPSGLQPRMAPFYNFKALITLLDSFGIVIGATSQLEQLAEGMKDTINSWKPSVQTEQNLAKQLAEKLAGKTPIIYGAKLYPAAYKWKINFNENAKNTAWCNAYPEFNHNEFLGWSSHPIEKPFAVIDLVSSFDHPQIKKRFEISDRLLSGKRPKAIQIHAEGETPLEQLLWVVALGDMTSIYLAILNGLNPTPVELIEKLKKELV